jgi:acetolactate synthase-1/2/3 large subunit
VIHLDIDPAEIDKNVKSTVPVWGDCKETLPLLTKLVDEKQHTDWVNLFNDYTRKEVEAVIHDELNPTEGEMTMGEVIKQLNDLTHGEAVIVTDVGQHQMVACRYALPAVAWVPWALPFRQPSALSLARWTVP